MAFVITHPDMGIYLGNCLGMGFWSKIDPVGQPVAVTFPTEALARSHIANYYEGASSGISFVPIVPDEGGYASIAACVAAGLDGWISDDIPNAISA